MAASSFEAFLFSKLRSLNTDHEVFGSYIIGIFTSEDSEEDKREALEGILGEVTEDTSELCDELLSQWKKFHAASLTNGNSSQIVVDIDAKLASIMEEQAKCVVTERQRTAEEQHLREIILAQCNRVDQEEDEEQDGILVDPGGEDLAATGGMTTADALQALGRNTNAEAVLLAEKEKRDKSKQDHEKKKAQDKVNKEKQKQQQQERKEKEKKRTQKGERKR